MWLSLPLLGNNSYPNKVQREDAFSIRDNQKISTLQKDPIFHSLSATQTPLARLPPQQIFYQRQSRDGIKQILGIIIPILIKHTVRVRQFYLGKTFTIKIWCSLSSIFKPLFLKPILLYFFVTQYLNGISRSLMTSIVIL